VAASPASGLIAFSAGRDVHVRDVADAAFARYVRVKPGNRLSTEIEIVINAHLCEVRRLGTPDEKDRNPSWFSAEKAKRRLREERADDYGDDLARIVDRAVARIQRLYRAEHGRRGARREAQVIEIDDARVRAINMKAAGKMPRRGPS